jgi:ribosomal-protein-alanine N-acetyltransferase
MEAQPAARAGVEEEYSIRRMAAADVHAVLALEAGVPEAAPWSRGDYERGAQDGFDAWVAANDKELFGFVVARRMADEMEILNLAVERVHRRRGVGRRLLEVAFEFARARGARRAFLEVRESNAGAIAFYGRQGFATTARRPRYYSDPVEDALVLSRQLDRGWI